MTPPADKRKKPEKCRLVGKRSTDRIRLKLPGGFSVDAALRSSTLIVAIALGGLGAWYLDRFERLLTDMDSRLRQVTRQITIIACTSSSSNISDEGKRQKNIGDCMRTLDGK